MTMSITINKDKVLAHVVRTFFKYFVTGIIESQSDKNYQECFEPRYIKKIMLDNYEYISRYFNKEAFYAIFRMNYKQEEMEQQLRSFMTTTTTDMDLIRFACRTEEFYNIMVKEYKRNFELLLLGHLESYEENEKYYTRGLSSETINKKLAEHIIKEIAENAYVQGKGLSDNDSLHLKS